MDQVLRTVQERKVLTEEGSLLKWFRDDESMVPCICTVMLPAGAREDVDCREAMGFLSSR